MYEEEEPSLTFLLLAHHQPKNLSRTIHVRFSGKSYHLCARCTGKYIGILTMVILYLLGLRIPFWLYISLLLSLPLPSTVDWVTQSLGMRESRNSMRVLTGFSLGIAWGLLLISLITGILGIFFYGAGILLSYITSIIIISHITNVLER